MQFNGKNQDGIDLIELMIKRKKTQTRRPLRGRYLDGDILRLASGRKNKAIGQDYAVCDGRGRPCVLFLEEEDQEEGTLHRPGSGGWSLITGDHPNYDEWRADNIAIPVRLTVKDIRIEDVREISRADAIAEGFGSIADFLLVWTDFYDSAGCDLLIELLMSNILTDESARHVLKDRTSELYQAYALDFTLNVGWSDADALDDYNDERMSEYWASQ